MDQMAGILADGSPLEQLIREAAADAAQEVEETLLNGIAIGQGASTIAYQITKVSNIPYERAVRIARTEINRSYRMASHEQYKASNGVVAGYRRMCFKPTACFACLMMDGEYYDKMEDFSDHPNGKCSAVPVTKHFDPGADPNWQRGRDWFMQQDEDTQRKLMGPGRLELWSSGGVDLRDMVYIKPNDIWGGSPAVRSLEQIKNSSTGLGYRGIFDFLKGNNPDFDTIFAKDSVDQKFPEWSKNEKMTFKQAVQGTNLNCQDETIPSWMYRQNCPKSAPVWELRRRGFLVESLPLSSEEDFYTQDNNWQLVFENGSENVIGNLHGDGKNDIKKLMDSWGNGSRCIIAISREEESGHIFAAENVNGKIVFIDPQWGTYGKEVESYFSEAADGLTQILRVDNLKFTNRIYDCATGAIR